MILTQLFVCLFKKTIKNILANHITNEFIICDVRTLQILDKFENKVQYINSIAAEIITYFIANFKIFKIS